MNERIKQLAEQATTIEYGADRGFDRVTFDKEKFAELVRADERARVTNLLMYMHNKAAPYHNYYKHAAVELNRKAGEGEKK